MARASGLSRVDGINFNVNSLLAKLQQTQNVSFFCSFARFPFNRPTMIFKINLFFADPMSSVDSPTRAFLI